MDMPLDNSYRKALEGIKSSCPSGTGHPSDFARVVHIFKALTDAGKFIDDPDGIYNYLIESGVEDSRTLDIQQVYQVLDTAKRDRAGWSDEFISEVLAD